MASLTLTALPASADRHAAQYLEHENRHLADHRGASSRHVDATLDLELVAGQATVTVAGSRRAHELFERYSTDDTTRFSAVYRGTWKRAGAALMLELALHSEACTREQTSSDGRREALTCAARSPKLAVTCARSSAPLRDTKPARQANVWTCTPTRGELPEQVPWVLAAGAGGCVRVLGGRGVPRAYEPCVASTP